jgi:hypothetical protein
MSLSRGTKEEAFSILPAGTVLPFAGAVAPSGWALCDGSTVSRANNPELYLAVGDAWGNGDGSTTFHLPDMRGKFMRGTDNAAGNDPDSGTRTAANAGGNVGDNVGTVQGDGTNSAGLTYVDTYLYSIDSDYVTPGGIAYTNVLPTLSRGIDNTSGRIYSGGGSGPPSDIRLRNLPATVSVTGGNSETRAKNANMNYIIKL